MLFILQWIVLFINITLLKGVENTSTCFFQRSCQRMSNVALKKCALSLPNILRLRPEIIRPWLFHKIFVTIQQFIGPMKVFLLEFFQRYRLRYIKSLFRLTFKPKHRLSTERGQQRDNSLWQDSPVSGDEGAPGNVNQVITAQWRRAP